VLKKRKVSSDMKKIKRNTLWLFLLAKRFFRKPMFIITLFCIPICVLALRTNTGKDEAVVRVAVYVEDEGNNELADEAMERLLEQSDSTVRFYQVDSYETLCNQVISDTAVCGFVFPEDFKSVVKALAEGDRSKLPYRKAAVKCVKKEGSNFVQIAKEVVFTSYYEAYSKEILLNYMLNNEEHGTDKMTEEDLELLEKYRLSYDIQSEFFTFYHLDGSENTMLKDDSVSYMMLPVRGLILTLILLASMTGGVMLFRDKEKGMFDSIVLERRGIINYIYFLIPAFMAGMIGIIGIMFSGTAEALHQEIISMIIYVFFVAGVCNFIRILAGDINIFVSTIPIFLLMNIILCPVFIDINGMIPMGSYIQKVLPVYYGLSSLYDGQIQIIMMVVGVLLLGVETKDKK